MNDDVEGLHEVVNTRTPGRKADIVFVHGLGGSSHRTWRHGKPGEAEYFFWPEELGKDLPDCSVWTIGYPAGFSDMGSPGTIIENRAGNLALKLANAGLGKLPLIFICHSMGGLVIKSLIVRSQTQADQNRKLIASMVRGLVFCATPHRGSEFATATGVLGKLRQEHVKEMSANAEPLDILHDEFIEWHKNHPIPIQSYAENFALGRKNKIGRLLLIAHKLGLLEPIPFLRRFPSGPIVTRTSANPGIVGYNVQAVDDDHLTLVKPRNRNHDVYAGVARLIRDILIENTSEQLPNQAKESETPLMPAPSVDLLGIMNSRPEEELLGNLDSLDPTIALPAARVLAQRNVNVMSVIDRPYQRFGPINVAAEGIILRGNQSAAKELTARVLNAKVDPRSANRAASLLDVSHRAYCQDALAEELENDSEPVREAVLIALGNLCAVNWSYKVFEFFDGERYRESWKALRCLYNMFCHAENTQDANYIGGKLRDAIKLNRERGGSDNNWSALGYCGGVHLEELIFRWTADELPMIRSLAAYTLGQIRAQRGTEALEKLCCDNDKSVKENASYALGMIETPESLAALMRTAPDSDGIGFTLHLIHDENEFRNRARYSLAKPSETRWAVIRAIGLRGLRLDYGSVATEFVNELREIANSTRLYVERGSALLALARIGDLSDRPRIESARGESSSNCSEQVMAHLAYLHFVPGSFEQHEPSLRRILVNAYVQESYWGFAPSVRRDIINELASLKIAGAAELANAWRPFFPGVGPTYISNHIV